jgi:mxaK protein
MRRRTAHLTFGALAAAFALLATYEGVRLREARQTNEAIAGARSSIATSTVPEAQFARAIALAKKGDYGGALQQYKVLSRGKRADLAADALYNEGNLHLREATRAAAEGPMRTLPLIELAKQRYRAVLRRDPQSWDARYNLQRALWMAPEVEETMFQSVQRDAENRVMSTLQSTRADLP